MIFFSLPRTTFRQNV